MLTAAFTAEYIIPTRGTYAREPGSKTLSIFTKTNADIDCSYTFQSNFIEN